MADERRLKIRAVINGLNAIGSGELGVIVARLESAERDLDELGEGELHRTIVEARERLGRGDLSNYRRLMSQAVARLGHLR